MIESINERAAARGSVARMTARITATPAAPVVTAAAALPSSIPPTATTGRCSAALAAAASANAVKPWGGPYIAFEGVANTGPN